MASESVVAVMGVTGAGKSSFIKLVTGDSSIKVGENLVSETSAVGTYKFRHKDRTIVLVDTPGFDDTYQKDADVLKLLANWFAATYRSGTKLSGIIYLHRITDDRMRGSSMRSMRMFRQLCGESFYRNLLLGTTCWSLIPEEIGKQREMELMTDENFWKGLIGKGAQFVRVPDNGFMAKELVYDLACHEPMALQIQHELVDCNVQFNSLSATQSLDNGMGKLAAEQEAEKRRLEMEHQRMVEDQNRREQELRRQLEQERHNKILEFRVNTEQTMIAESLAKFTEGVKNSIYIAKMHVLADAFAKTCDRCCKWVGNAPYYVCSICNEGKFVLCDHCWSSNSASCYDQSHHTHMKKLVASDASPKCRHTQYPVAPEAHFACYRCGNNIEGLFVHCCVCLSDGFNMCLDCLTPLGTCKKSWSLSGHRLFPLIRRTRYQGIVSASTGGVNCQTLFEQAKEYKKQENWAEAEKTFLSVLTERQKDHGPEDELVRDSKYNLGQIYHELGRTGEAISMFEAAMEGEEKAFGPGDTRTMYTAFDLGRVYKKENRLVDAERMFLYAIGREKSFGAKDFAVRISRYNLGNIYSDRGERGKAVEMFEGTLKGEEEQLGVEHEDTLLTVSRLADLYKLLGRYDDSEKSYLRVLAGKEKSLGQDDKSLLDNYYNLGLTFKLALNYDGAIIQFGKALAGYERTLGLYHTDVQDAINQLAEVSVLDGKLTEASNLYTTLIERREIALGPDHEKTHNSRKKLAEVSEKLEYASMTRRKPLSFQPQVSANALPMKIGLDGYITELIEALPSPPEMPSHQMPQPWNAQRMQLVFSGQLPLDTRDGAGHTPFLWAIIQNDQSSATHLLNMGSDSTSKDNFGKSAIHLSIQNGNSSLTQFLLDRGADLNARDAFGQTPLHLAVLNGREECVRVLLQAGVDGAAKNGDGLTALQLAAAQKQTGIMTLLILGCVS